MRQLLNFSFYQRLQAFFLLLILFPTLLMTYYNYYNTSNSVKEKVRDSDEFVLAIMSKDISKMLDDLTYTSTIFIQDPNAIALLREFRETSRIESSTQVDNYYRVKEYLSIVATKTMNPDIRMFLANEHGFTALSSDTRYAEESVADHRILNTLIDKNQGNIIQWLGTIPDRSTERSPYYLSRVFRDPADRSLLATLYIGIPIKYFDKLFDQVVSGSITLYDISGQLIAGNPEIPFDSQHSNNQNIRTESMIEKAGWKLVLETPREDVTGVISRNFFVSLLITFPFFLLFLLFSLLAAKRLYLPIRLLQNGAKMFGQGLRNIRFPVRGNDELSDLGRTLNIMLVQINDLIAGIEQEQEQKLIFELQALFAQIRPHFLLNTLNSIKCNLAIQDDEIHSRQIESLMNLLRGYMKINEPATLEHEFKLLRDYIEIMQMRSDIEVRREIYVDPALAEMEFPRLLLQPIVENIFVHGFNEDIVEPCLSIRATRIGGKVHIVITDNGLGISEERAAELNRILLQSLAKPHPEYDRIGLANTLQRLRLTYGKDSLLKLTPSATGGTAVEMIFDFIEKEAVLHESLAGR